MEFSRSLNSYWGGRTKGARKDEKLNQWANLRRKGSHAVVKKVDRAEKSRGLNSAKVAPAGMFEKPAQDSEANPVASADAAPTTRQVNVAPAPSRDAPVAPAPLGEPDEVVV